MMSASSERMQDTPKYLPSDKIESSTTIDENQNIISDKNPLDEKAIEVQEQKTGNSIQVPENPPNQQFLYENFIIQESRDPSNESFQCRICFVKILNRAAISEHVTSDSHKIKFNESKLSFLGDHYVCDICKCSIYGLKNVGSHLCGVVHEMNKLAGTSGHLFKRVNRKILPPRKNNENTESSQNKTTGNSKETEEQFFSKNFIVHIAKVPTYGDFQCSKCAIKLFNRREMLQHSATKAPEETPNGTFECKLCVHQMPDRVSMLKHVADLSHKIKVMRTMVSFLNDHYSCLACNCRIDGLDAVALHLNDSLHTQNLVALRKKSLLKIRSWKSSPLDSSNENSSGKKGETDKKQATASSQKASLENTNKTNQQKSKNSPNENIECKAWASEYKPLLKTKIPRILTSNTKNENSSEKCGQTMKERTTESSRKDTTEKGPSETQTESRQIVPAINNTFHVSYRPRWRSGASNLASKPSGTGGTSKSREIKKKSWKKPKISAERAALRAIKKARGKVFQLLWAKLQSELDQPVRCNFCSLEVENLAKFHSHVAGHIIIHEESPNEILPENQLSCHPIFLKDEPEKKSATIVDNRLMKIEQRTKTYNLNEIYDLKEKLQELELGTKMCYPMNEENTYYCLVCQKVMIDEMIEDHLSDSQHLEYMEEMLQDDKIFAPFPKQLSSLALGLEYMMEKSQSEVYCHVCQTSVDNTSEKLTNHIGLKSHVRARTGVRLGIQKVLDKLRKRFRCDWYRVDKYFCVVCSVNFVSEEKFLRHMAMERGRQHVTGIETWKETLMFDFCDSCACLWYGYRGTRAHHMKNDMHIWLERDGLYKSDNLPGMAQRNLRNFEAFCAETMSCLPDGNEDSHKEQRAFREVSDALGSSRIIGSRSMGLALRSSHLDIYLDSVGKSSSSFITDRYSLVIELLAQNPDTWITNGLPDSRDVRSLSIYHVPTDLHCDLAADNQCLLEGTKLIQSFVDASPVCRRLILLLKRWMALCDLVGPEKITSYALYWLVIFYLQTESILPSVEAMNSTANEPRKAVDEVAVVPTCDNDAALESEMKELMMKFFAFWSNFNYRYESACPKIGKTMKRCELQRIVDSPMSLQNPTNCNENLTRNVSKVDVRLFSSYCASSLQILKKT